MLERNIDALVLGCTHYPLVRPLIEKIAGPDVRVIEPSEAIARRVEKVLEQHQFSAPLDATGILECYTSGDPESFRSCLLYTSDAADERSSVDLGGRRIIKKKKNNRKDAR